MEKSFNSKINGSVGIRKHISLCDCAILKMRLELFLSKGLWCHAIVQKHNDRVLLVGCIISPFNSHHIGSIIYKATIKEFYLISRWLEWKVGDGHKIMIGDDLWVGCGEI